MVIDSLNEESIIALHKKEAPSDAAFRLVYEHCRIVWELAESLIEESRLEVDLELVKYGCLLHDIGVYRLYLPSGEIDHVNYVKHGILGDETLKRHGIEERIRRIASCHTGVGLTVRDIEKQNLPLPHNDYVAQTPEERLVMYVDKFHSKTTPPVFLSFEAYCRHVERFGQDKVVRFREFAAEFGVPDLRALAKKYNLEIIM